MPLKNVGPGPARYLLPPTVGYKDHDASRYRNPQWSLGIKLPGLGKGLGPGPKYNTENMTPHGKALPPAWSLKSRPKTLTMDQKPGPAEYDIRSKHPPNPAFSIRSRHPQPIHSVTPGPNQYELPSTLGPKVPDLHANGAFSMSFKHNLNSAQGSPGPAAYPGNPTDVYKIKAPAYSMSRRLPMSDKSKSPGPQAYYPKLSKAGGVYMGIRHDGTPYITPDDNMPCITQ